MWGWSALCWEFSGTARRGTSREWLWLSLVLKLPAIKQVDLGVSTQISPSCWAQTPSYWSWTYLSTHIMCL